MRACIHVDDHNSAAWAIIDQTHLIGADGEATNRTGRKATVDWYRDNEQWWRPQKDATEAVYATKESVLP